MDPVEPYVGGRFDGSWAEEWVASEGVQRTKSFDEIVRGRPLLPAIGDPEVEAQKASDAYWNDKMNEPAGDGDDVNPGSTADVARTRASVARGFAENVKPSTSSSTGFSTSSESI